MNQRLPILALAFGLGCSSLLSRPHASASILSIQPTYHQISSIFKPSRLTPTATVHPTATLRPTATITPMKTPTPPATATPSPTSAPSATSTPAPTGIGKGILEPGGSLFSAESQAGFTFYRLEVHWDQAEPSNGVFDDSYFQTVRNTMATARAAGLTPVLSLGMEYPPSWVFSLDPAGSRLVDQYGDVWTGNSVGEHIANGIFSQPVRGAMAAYVAHVFQALGATWGGVNWGGGLAYDEARYPGCPGGRTNCFWAFDANARAQNPVPSYTPATGNQAEAQTFVNWYNKSLQNYLVWGMSVIRQYYAGSINVLLPSWGVRPGDIQNAVAVNLNGSVYRSSEVAGGMDWADQLPAFAAYAPVTIDCTWANRLDDPWNDPQDWGPVHYLASILPTGMSLGGENTFGATSVTDMNNIFGNARAYNLRWVMWMNEAATQTIGNATLQQIGSQ
jgi:hypothetical protein